MTTTTTATMVTSTTATTTRGSSTTTKFGPWDAPFDFPISFEHDQIGLCPRGWTCKGKNIRVCNVPYKTVICNHPGLEGQHGHHYFTIGNDFDTGNATSVDFTLPRGADRLSFRRSGGADKGSGLFVKRVHDDEVLCVADKQGNNSNTFHDDACPNLSKHAGERVYILIKDNQASPWGKVLVDDIHLQNAFGMDIVTTHGLVPGATSSHDD